MNVRIFHKGILVACVVVLAGCGTVQPYVDKVRPYLDSAKKTVYDTVDKIGLDEIEIKPTPDKLPGDEGS